MTRQCWICYAEEEDVLDAMDDDRWVQPCLCKGTTRWVHQDCLLDWVNSRLVADASTLGQEAGGPLATTCPVACPQCHAPYKVFESYLVPKMVLTAVDRIMLWKDRMVTVLLAVSVSGSVWLICFAYGAAAFSVSVGPEEAKTFFLRYGTPLLDLVQMRAPDFGTVLQAYMKLVVGIPYIPIAILSNRFRFLQSLSSYLLPLILWDGYDSLSLSWPPTSNLTTLLLPVAYQGYRHLRRRILSPAHLLPGGGSSISNSALSSSSSVRTSLLDPEDELVEEAELALKISEDSIVSLLIMPAASSLTGWLLFRRIEGMSTFHRTFLGGLVVSVLSDAGRALYQYQATYARRSRRILNWK